MLMSVSLNAQNRSGIKSGFVNSISPNVVPEASYLPSFYVAGFHERTMGESKVFWMYGGTEYTRVGWFYDDQNYQQLSYLSFPHALKIKLGPLFTQLGYSLNFKIGEKIYEDGYNVKNAGNKSRLFNLPVHAGIGLNLGPLVIDARYNYGLLKLNDAGTKVNYIMLGAGLRF